MADCAVGCEPAALLAVYLAVRHSTVRLAVRLAVNLTVHVEAQLAGLGVPSSLLCSEPWREGSALGCVNETIPDRVV